MNKKKLLVVSLIICALAILSMGTIAWFNASVEITNTFKMADTDGNGTSDFSILAEEATVDGTGTTTTGNTYEGVTPGSVFGKNPSFENTGDYNQYIRASVTFDEYAKLKAAYDTHSKTFDLTEWLDIDDTVWTYDSVTTDTVANTVTYVYYLNTVLKAEDDPATPEEDDKVVFFSEVTIPNWFDQNDMDFVSENFTITVKADALQSDNMDKTNAKDAFGAYWN